MRRQAAANQRERLSLWGKDIASMNNWEYGQDVGSNYRARECVPLERGHAYGVNLFHSAACVTMTRFRIDQRGLVSALGKSDTVCGR
jgi:hypothetical protein